jgi:hypothetical protein
MIQLATHFTAFANQLVSNAMRLVFVGATVLVGLSLIGAGTRAALTTKMIEGAGVAAFATSTEPAINNPDTGMEVGVGAPDIPTTDHDVMRDLQPTWGSGSIPGSSAPDVVGAFRFNCRHTNLAADDPTVFPGRPGASHLHDQTGVYGWNAYSNYRNLRTGGGGSGCNDVAGTDHNPAERNWSANRTPYWQPALLDGKGNAIVADYTSFYYKRRPASDPIVNDPANSHFQGKAVPLPNGLKFIFGAYPDDPNRKPDAQFKFACVKPDWSNKDMTFADAVQCAKQPGNRLEAHQTAPDCSWGFLKCDRGHPYVIPAFTYAVFYTILPTDDGDIHLSSDEMDNRQARGWSFHVDYGPAAWDPLVLKMWTDNCINKMLNCSGGDLGNGRQLKGAAKPIYYEHGSWSASLRIPNRLVPIQHASRPQAGPGQGRR